MLTPDGDGQDVDTRNRSYGDAIDLSESIVAFFGPKGQRSRALGNAQGKRGEKPNSPDWTMQKELLGANLLAQAVSPFQG